METNDKPVVKEYLFKCLHYAQNKLYAELNILNFDGTVDNSKDAFYLAAKVTDIRQIGLVFEAEFDNSTIRQPKRNPQLRAWGDKVDIMLWYKRSQEAIYQYKKDHKPITNTDLLKDLEKRLEPERAKYKQLMKQRLHADAQLLLDQIALIVKN